MEGGPDWKRMVAGAGDSVRGASPVTRVETLLVMCHRITHLWASFSSLPYHTLQFHDHLHGRSHLIPRLCKEDLMLPIL